MFVLISGSAKITRRDPLGNLAPIVEQGPAGLATAVYAASEGLSVVVFDARAFGGQAGASANIENYLGFPTGISGQALAGRAYVQAQKFGAQMVIPTEVVRLDCNDTPLALGLADGSRIKARAAVVASGARYRRPAIPQRGDRRRCRRGGAAAQLSLDHAGSVAMRHTNE